jgi:GAF domain
VASAGHAAGTFTVNQPLSEWNDFLPTLLAGKCAFQRYGDDLSVTLRARLVALGAGSFLACPVIDIEGRVLGATVVTWDERDPPPIGEDLRSLMEFARSICVQIAAALDLRGRLPSPLGLRAAG